MAFLLTLPLPSSSVHVCAHVYAHTCMHTRTCPRAFSSLPVCPRSEQTLGWVTQTAPGLRAVLAAARAAGQMAEDPVAAALLRSCPGNWPCGFPQPPRECASPAPFGHTRPPWASPPHRDQVLREMRRAGPAVGAAGRCLRSPSLPQGWPRETISAMFMHERCWPPLSLSAFRINPLLVAAQECGHRSQRQPSLPVDVEHVA